MLNRVRRQGNFDHADEVPAFPEGEPCVVCSEWISLDDAVWADYFTVLTGWVRGAFMMDAILRLKGPFQLSVTWETAQDEHGKTAGRYVARPQL